MELKNIFPGIYIYSSPHGQNGRHILIKISLKFVPKGQNDKPAIWHQAIIWTNADLIHWHIHAALGGDELINWQIWL